MPASSPTFKHPSLIINAASGSTSDISDAVTDIFRNRFNLDIDCHFIEPQKLTDTIESVLKNGADLLVTYGGDGTSLAAISLASPQKVPTLPLPGGTMNVLPKRLYGSDKWQEVLSRALDCDAPVWIPAGRVNDKDFLVAGIFGAIVEIGQAREMVRDGEYVEAFKQVSTTLRDALPGSQFTFSPDNIENKWTGNFLQVTCPFMNDYADQEDKFDVVANHVETLVDVTALGLTTLFDLWRQDDSANVTQSGNMTIHGSGQISALLDGEPETISLPADISLSPNGALILCPSREV